MFLNCDSHLTNAECRFISGIENINDLTPGLSIRITIAMMLLELMTIIAGFLLQLLFTGSSVHPNLARILIVFLLHFYVLVVSRIGLMLFETGTILRDDEYMLTIFMCVSIAHVHECVFAPLFFIGFIVERIFATVYISTYERRKSTLISSIIIMIIFPLSVFIAISGSLGVMYNFLFTFSVICGMGSVAVSSALIASIYVYRRNKRFLEKARTATFYSLSTKFQLMENFHAFQALVKCTICVGIAVSFAGLFIFLHLYYRETDENLSSVFGEAFNFSHTIAMPVAYAVIVHSIPTMKRDFQLIFPIKSRYACCIPAPASVEVEHVNDATGESYFKNLLGSWDTRHALR